MLVFPKKNKIKYKDSAWDVVSELNIIMSKFVDIYPREYLVIGNQYHFEIVALAMLGILKEKN
jgi:hypothetical protein